jgi:hypothetical protein
MLFVKSNLTKVLESFFLFLVPQSWMDLLVIVFQYEYCLNKKRFTFSKTQSSRNVFIVSSIVLIHGGTYLSSFLNANKWHVCDKIIMSP